MFRLKLNIEANSSIDGWDMLWPIWALKDDFESKAQIDLTEV